ncbi:hypothetical protein CPB84DRAFT_1686615, partial [Gymnopilus junonius]
YWQIYLDELLHWAGQGDFRSSKACPDCLSHSSLEPGLPLYHCEECMVPDLTCSSCCVRRHRSHPFHHIEVWQENCFVHISLKSLGFRIQLNHSGTFCENPIPTHNSMLIIHTNGIHEVNLYYCGCS